MVEHDTGQAEVGLEVDSDSGRRGYILVIAARLFREHGYLNTTMTEIARACGLGQSSLYYWFRQKEDILLGLLVLFTVYEPGRRGEVGGSANAAQGFSNTLIAIV